MSSPALSGTQNSGANPPPCHETRGRDATTVKSRPLIETVLPTRAASAPIRCQ